MKSITLFVCTLFIAITGWAQTSDKIDPQKSEMEREQLLSIPAIQKKIEEGEKIEVGGASGFKQTLIVTFQKELGEDFDPDVYEAVQHVFMFLSSDHRWLCEFRNDMTWEYDPESKIVMETVEEPGDFSCYPRL